MSCIRTSIHIAFLLSFLFLSCFFRVAAAAQAVKEAKQLRTQMTRIAAAADTLEASNAREEATYDTLVAQVAVSNDDALLLLLHPSQNKQTNASPPTF